MAAVALDWNRVTWLSVALLVAQVLHGLAPADAEAEENAVGLVLGVLGLLATIVLVVSAVRRSPRAQTLLLLVPGSITVGFLAYHGLPFASSVTNPYWGDGSATGLQWATVVVVVGLALTCVREAVAARAPAPAPSQA
jgi:hypothetical protein